MLKAQAIELLGGTTAAAAQAVGVTYQAVDKWPEQLPPRIEDRVLAALYRKQKPKPVGQFAQQPAAKKAFGPKDDDFDPTTSIDNSSKG